MNAGQLKKYWWMFGAVRAYYRGRGFSADEIEARRKAIHRKVLGSEKSATALDDHEINEIKKAFHAVWDGGNFDAQLGFIEDEATHTRRLVHRVEQLGKACGIDRGIEGVADYFKNWFRGRAFEKLNDLELRELVGLLERREKQIKRKRDAENPF